jgi:DNA-directed RNA polymerase subunit RPC12/RpoP
VKVQCSKCGEAYYLKSDENPSDFQCKCGGELIIKYEPTKILESPKNTSNGREIKTPESSNSIFDDWKKQYMIIVGVIILVFALIAVDSSVIFGDLVLTNVTAPSTAVRGQTIIIPHTINNNGILPTNDCNVTFQFTPGKNSENIIFLGKIRISELFSGDIITQNTTFTVPQNMTPGRYYIRVVVDSNKEIYEANENNNEIYSSTQVNIV